MKRKLFYPVSLLLCVLMLTACGGKKKEAKAFAEKFVAYVNGDQLDSIFAVYPDANFNSLAPLSADSISVEEEGEGIYKINFSGGKWIEVKNNGTWGFEVIKSKGIAAFPEEKYEIAQKTGMITDTVSDVLAQKLLNNQDYFDWLKKNYNNGGYAIQINPGKYKSIWNSSWGEYWKGSITITLTNLSDAPVSGSDYFITYKTSESNGYTDYSERYYTKNNKHKGIDLKPKESGNINLTQGLTSKFYNFEIKPVEGKENVLKYEFKPTGNEYQIYLKEAGNSANGNYDWLSTREATHKDLEHKSKEELRIMRNWIYARHGYIFKSPDLAEYFSKFSWYEPTSSNVTSEFNKTEQANVALIQSYE